MKAGDVFASWGKVLTGKTPLLSIEITSPCPLSCPGCYAYGDDHLGGLTTLRGLSDSRGDFLMDGILKLVDEHDPLQLSLVCGEPLLRHRELSKFASIPSARRSSSVLVAR